MSLRTDRTPDSLRRRLRSRVASSMPEGVRRRVPQAPSTAVRRIVRTS